MMAESGPGPGPGALQVAMKLASAAVQLDTENRHREAYCEYLKSIKFISQALIEDAQTKGEREMVTPEVQKMLKLAEQCLGRIKTTATKLGKAETKAAVSQAVKPSYTPTHRRVVSDGGGTNKSFLTPDVFQKLQLPETLTTKRELTPLEEASRQNQKLKAAYEARMARLNPNQSSQKTSLTLSLQRQMMENLIIAKARQAALQRKMEERRLRLQEEANRRFSTNATLTPEEEEQRNVYASILEFEQDHEWPKQWKLKLKSQPNDLILVGGLVSQILSCPEHPISQLLKKLQCRIYSKLYPIVNTHFSDQVALTEPNAGTGLYPAQSQCLLNTDVKSSLHKGSRLKSSKSACCLGSVQDHVKNNSVRLRHSSSVTSVVSVEDHNANTDAWDPKAPGSNIMKPSCSTKDFAPNQASEKNSPFEDLEQDMMKFELQPGSIADNMNLAVNSGQQILETEDMQLQDHLKNIVKDVHNSIDRLLTLCILAFEPLDSATGKDQCLASIEETFFQPIWMFLLALFRKVNHSREMALDKSLKLYRTAGPADVGVSDKLFPHKSTPSIGSYPYEIAVQELRSISKEFCPQKKLECIVRTLRLICDCAEQYCGSRQSGALIVSAIGADDLLPILSYVVLKSNLTQLVSECAALEEFIHEGYLIGEEGYCLTSMQSALLNAIKRHCSQ
ncbi:VPS9 domain-containing protein 1 isoform X3 [Callorhinchus milii]|uniref:VPS9 domain-containing protein 1 isoform X3 n=1 Tax=Callorhinchus milii TaxID=7868 RepID=UPI00045721F9|nr:VPS9 domain-containing protein 1 isoform X3 [Callorhinchus milii]|eukprot:gi/632944369/ref/XP_007887471.1/ PREDICTED: VPS9 domain-containing protein 1 isoform X1 [Callorhinchus milii]